MLLKYKNLYKKMKYKKKLSNILQTTNIIILNIPDELATLLTEIFLKPVEFEVHMVLCCLLSIQLNNNFKQLFSVVKILNHLLLLVIPLLKLLSTLNFVIGETINFFKTIKVWKKSEINNPIEEGYWITVAGTFALDTIIAFYVTEGYWKHCTWKRR